MFWMGGRLREIPSIGFWEGKFGVLDEWSLTRGSNYRVLSGNNFLLWMGGRLREVPTIKLELGKIWCFG